MAIERFTPPFSASEMDDLRERLSRTRWPDESPGVEWTSGVDRHFIMDLCRYWRDEFDWEAQLGLISAFDHYRYDSGRGRIHFIYERGRGPSPMPLILTHGWPGSFVEMLKLIRLLTDPKAHGHDACDSFDVIVPSLPGFGFSDRPSEEGMNVFSVAELWVKLMHELGYERFGAQGGDLGAGVTTALGLRHPDQIAGLHLNYVPGSYLPYLDSGPPLTGMEEAFRKGSAEWLDRSGAYAHLQGTRPQTAAYGLNDSPAGLAAWIVEKFREWSDCEGDVYRRFTRDELLTNVTLYWMTETIASSFRMYFEGRRAPLHFSAEDFVRPPCAMAHFPKEIMFPPREWVERGYNVQRWTTMPRGGHFAAAEEPELLAADLREFFRSLRE